MAGPHSQETSYVQKNVFIYTSSRVILFDVGLSAAPKEAPPSSHFSLGNIGQ